MYLRNLFHANYINVIRSNQSSKVIKHNNYIFISSENPYPSVITNNSHDIVKLIEINEFIFFFFKSNV